MRARRDAPGGDPDCAAARAFIEMRNQYKEARGEEISDEEEEKNNQTSNENNNNKPINPQSKFSDQSV